MGPEELSRKTIGDVRMRGFSRRTTVRDALQWLDSQLAQLDAEWLPLLAVAGRILAKPISSEVDVPGFERSMMDGFAVQAADTFAEILLELV